MISETFWIRSSSRTLNSAYPAGVSKSTNIYLME
jgi:hypothetical protein